MGHPVLDDSWRAVDVSLLVHAAQFLLFFCSWGSSFCCASSLPERGWAFGASESLFWMNPVLLTKVYHILWSGRY